MPDLASEGKRKPIRVVVYSRPGCKLCEIALELAQGLSREFDLAIETVDISRDPELFSQFRDSIPVVIVGSETTLRAPIRLADLRKALEQAGVEREEASHVA